MELALYVSKLKLLEELDDTLQTVDISHLPRMIVDNFFRKHPNSVEYWAHLTALDHLYDTFGSELGIERCYFGQEFCQNLIPNTDTLQAAYYYSRQLGWRFTYITPGPVTDAGIARIREHLDFLAAEAPDAEVVINNWALLRILPNEYPMLSPVLGRMLTKQQRSARYVKRSIPVLMSGISVDHQAISENQSEALSGLDLSLASYRSELRRCGVNRVDIDIVPQGADIPVDQWGFGISCYYPWTYVTGGRNCLTAAADDPRRDHVVLETPCSQPCRTQNSATCVLGLESALLERGNSIFLLNHDFADYYLTGQIPTDRVIFTPYIPI